MKTFLTPRFRRSFKRLVSRNEELRRTVSERLLLFERDSKNPFLKDHALQGKLKGYRAFSLGYDLRALYRKEKNMYIFFDIGTHHQIYR